MRVLVAGAGGFIGGHLVKRLLDEGHYVIAADKKPKHLWWQCHDTALNYYLYDLSLADRCASLMCGVDHVYNLAADMGGIGFIETHKADCMLSVLINTHLLMAAVAANVQRYFYASSACVYHASLQNHHHAVKLSEADAYFDGGAMPEDGYGWEKLFSERMCRHFWEDKGIETRVARFHNVYGPHGSWCDGREKAPAAICRKVAEAVRDNKKSIEVWGDGTQTRSFMYVDDCVDGIRQIMESDIREPINLGSSELVSVNQLVDATADIAGVWLARDYNLDAPKGVAGRNSDNSLIQARLGWQPSTSLREGLGRTYPWIAAQVAKQP